MQELIEKQKQGKPLTKDEAASYANWRREEAQKLSESVYWSQILKPEIMKAEKFLENRILNGQCVSHEDYVDSCTQREAVKNALTLFEKDLNRVP